MVIRSFATASKVFVPNIVILVDVDGFSNNKTLLIVRFFLLFEVDETVLQFFGLLAL
jgi:hypothetical protein